MIGTTFSNNAAEGRSATVQASTQLDHASHQGFRAALQRANDQPGEETAGIHGLRGAVGCS